MILQQCWPTMKLCSASQAGVRQQTTAAAARGHEVTAQEVYIQRGWCQEEVSNPRLGRLCLCGAESCTPWLIGHELMNTLHSLNRLARAVLGRLEPVCKLIPIWLDLTANVYMHVCLLVDLY